MELALFYITLTLEVLATACVLVSIIFPRRRIWPPPRQHTWQGYLTWFLFLASAGGVFALGVIGWGDMALAPWIRFVVGILLGCVGHTLATWAMAMMSIAASYGGERALVRRGPYWFSRNLQYVGFILALIGWALLASSDLGMVASFVGVIPLIVVPLAEEPRLLARHGVTYETYRRTVPRFIPLGRQGDTT
jgi:protein-S-isoprenylcysteine O-methyltransferase Ste14